VKMARWHGEDAYVASGGGLSAIVVPERGGKIVSLSDESGYEWLVGPPDPLPPPASPGDVFRRAEMCGWDECLPTINACALDDATLYGDHGNAWSLPWRVIGDAMHVYMEELGLSLTRSISATPAGLRLTYDLSAERVLPILWAAHPQVRAPRGSRIELPPAVREVIDVMDEPARRAKWDATLASVDSVPEGGCRKVYVSSSTRSGAASLVTPSSGTLTFRWDPESLPYLGLWFDKRVRDAEARIAIEPTNGYYDDAARAAKAGTVAIVSPDAPLHWWLEVAHVY